MKIPWFLRKHWPVLRVPDKFNRNSVTVTSLMPPEESGAWLLRRMQEHLGLADYSQVSLLDYGCGVRFTQSILNLGLPIGEYVGVDCYQEMIEFLVAAVKDRRFSFHLLDVPHPLYNPLGAIPLGPDTRLPVAEGHFDVVCLFSVMTHLDPDDAGLVLRLLRRVVRPDGRLFFTCFLDDAIDAFEDRSPEGNGGRCHYNAKLLEGIVGQSGWKPLSRHPAEAPLIGDSYVCSPV